MERRFAGTLRDQQRQFTRARLIEAARSVMTERGYFATTIEDIASEAGASRATFYLHFNGKAELVEALIDETNGPSVQRYRDLDALMERGDLTPTTLRAWLSEWFGVWREGAAGLAAMNQAASTEPSVERRMAEVSLKLIDALEHAPWNAPGVKPKQAAAHRQRFLMLEVMSQRVLYVATAELLPLPEAEVLDVLVGLWWDVLGDDAASG